jgi:ATP-binding cassette subfamily B protein
VSSAADPGGTTTPRAAAVRAGMTPRARWRWLWPYVRRQTAALAAVVGLAAIGSVLSIGLPYLSKLIIDRGLIGRNFPLLLELCTAVLGLACASFIVGGLNRWLYVRASGRILFSLREDVYAHLLALPPDFYRRRATGDLVTRLDGDVAEIQRFSTDTLLAFINGALLLAATAGIMIALSWPLALLAAGVLPLQLALRHRARPTIAARTRAVREQASGIAQFLFETLSAVKAIQGLVAERWERARLHALNDTYLSRLLSQQLVSYAIGGISGLLSHAATAAVFVYGGYRVIEGSLTVGTLVAFVAYMARSTGSAISLLNLYTAYQRAAVSLERVEELLAVEVTAGLPAAGAPGAGLPAAGAAPAGRESPRSGALTLDNVSFGGKICGRPLLSGCSLQIPAGRKAVIYGASGAGKSTFVDALRRFAPLDQGRILLDGEDIDRIDIGELRRSIEVLVSEPVIFRGSILDNLRYGNFTAPESAVLAAARRAGVDAIVEDFTEGFATLIGSGGQGLSTGQRQRIAIARALLRNPRLVVLDEALTNLDAAGAEELHAVIDEQFADCTRIVISHAPTRVPRADIWYEMRDLGFALRRESELHA